MKKIRLLSLFFAFCLTVVGIFGLAGLTKAQDSKSITIIPPKFELFGNPGDTLTENIRVRNDSSAPFTYQVVVEDFSSSGEEGFVVLEEDSDDDTYSLAGWIDFQEDELLIQPGEEVTFTFNIIIPRDAEPGGHYASVLFQSGSEPEPGTASVTQRIGSLVLLRVSGNVVEEAAIESFTVPGFSQTSPVDLTLRVKNNGNVHVQPKGTIIITNLFGQKVDEIPLQGANVLPEAVRKMDTQWERQNALGIYTATLVATYGQQNIPLTAAARFAVASTTALILITVIGLAGIILMVSLISGRGRLIKALKVLAGGS